MFDGLIDAAAVGGLLSQYRGPDNVTMYNDSSALCNSDDLLTPGADEDLTSPLPGQEQQALLQASAVVNNYPATGLHFSAALQVAPSNYLRCDIPGYKAPADYNGQ